MVNGAGPILCPTPPIPDSNWNRHYHSSSETFCGGAKTCGALAVPALQSIKAIHDPLRSKGHGSTLGMRLDNPFVFFMQVRKHYCKCFRSDNPCIIVLPCPRFLCSCVYELASCLTELLLLAGDVETNPGPKTDELLQKLELIAGDIKEIKEDRLTSIDKKLENLDVLATNISSCVEQVAHLQEVVSALELKVDDLENRSRRCNLIIYGIPENQNEDNSTLEETVTETVFKEKLDIDGVGIERIHSLGKPATNKTRPTILKLLDFRDKTRVFKNCHKLKGTDLSVSEDFSVRVRDIRRNLRNYRKAVMKIADIETTANELEARGTSQGAVISSILFNIAMVGL
nr:uncharacterized protein LOC119176932 [Rhipicephalus microplus]